MFDGLVKSPLHPSNQQDEQMPNSVPQPFPFKVGHGIMNRGRFLPAYPCVSSFLGTPAKTPAMEDRDTLTLTFGAISMVTTSSAIPVTIP